MKPIIATLLLALIILPSCSKEQSYSHRKHKIGQFVYIDYYHAIHIDRQCASKIATNPRTKEERIANMQGVTFMDTAKLEYTWPEFYTVGHMADKYKCSHPYTFCPKCIDDVTYKHLAEIMYRNSWHQD